MGPAILARALGGDVPYAVKVHGSALEYTVRPKPERFLPYAREGLEARRGGARRLASHRGEPVGGDGRPALPERTRLGPPGRGRARVPARAADLPRPGAARIQARRRVGVARRAPRSALRALDPSRDRIVSYVGKLIVSKGVDLLLAAWPLVVAQVPDARLVVVGFGTYRDALGRLWRRSRRRDLGGAARDRGARARARGRPGRASSRTSPRFSTPSRGRPATRTCAAPAAARVCFTGRLEHSDLPAAAARLRGPGGAEHLPGGVRDGRRRGRGVRGAAAVRQPLRAGRGHRHADGRPDPSICAR